MPEREKLQTFSYINYIYIKQMPLYQFVRVMKAKAYIWLSSSAFTIYIICQKKNYLNKSVDKGKIKLYNNYE